MSVMNVSDDGESLRHCARDEANVTEENVEIILFRNSIICPCERWEAFTQDGR